MEHLRNMTEKYRAPSRHQSLMVLSTSHPLICKLGTFTYSLMKIIPKTAFTSRFGKHEYLKVPFGLAQAPTYFQELMIKILKDLPFVITYLDDITPGPFTPSFPQALQCRTNYEIEQVSLLCQGNSIFWPCPQHYWHQTTTLHSSSYWGNETP